MHVKNTISNLTPIPSAGPALASPPSAAGVRSVVVVVAAVVAMLTLASMVLAQPARHVADDGLLLPAEQRPLIPCTILSSPQRGTYNWNLWPMGIVPYEFDDNVDATNQQRALDAMAEIEAVSCVDFVPREWYHLAWLHILESTMNASDVGMGLGQQDVHIFNWTFRFVIVHELMHALGLWHEQQRPDRDDFVQIHWDRIEPGFERNFEIPWLGDAHGAYDFDSVMHYKECAFSTCGDCPSDPDSCRTIAVLAPNEWWQSRVGQREHLSAGDIAVVRALYRSTQQAKLLASDGAGGDLFGWSVSVSGDTAVIGAWWDDDSGTNSGSAYVFRFNGWSWVQQAKLLPSDGAAGDDFGLSVSVSGDTAVIGARFDDDNDPNSGSAYVFRYSGSSWVQQAKLLAADGAAGDNFGLSVSVSGDTAVIGAPQDDDYLGSGYVFRLNGLSWIQEAKLLGDDGPGYDHLGCSVSVSGDTTLVGAPGVFGLGSAYVFGPCANAFSDPPACPGDLDADDDIDLSDLAELLANYGMPCSASYFHGDLDDDGDVDLADLAELLGRYGDDCE